jgi:hypothetical protein
MSRWSSLNQALAKASASWSGFSRNRFEISRYAGSVIIAMSAVDIVGGFILPSTWASGTMKPSFTSRGCHCLAPAGDSTSSHSWEKIVSR